MKTLILILLMLVSILNFNESTLIKQIEPVNFIVLGDWGGNGNEPYTTKAQREVASQMQKYTQANNASFVLSVGDNFYPNGVNSSNDIRFNATFENVYVKNHLKNTPWFLCLGNHDHRLYNGHFQIQYSEQNKLWNLPHFFYTFKIIIESNANDTERTAKFIVIDTTLLCNLFDQRRERRDYVNTRYYDWLVKRLIDSLLDDYVFIVGHHTINSFMSGRHPSSCMSKYLNPLLTTFKVTAYLSGHDHTLQHSIHNDAKHKHVVHYFVSGAGANTYKKTIRNGIHLNESLFYWAESSKNTTNGGFLTFSLYRNFIEYYFYNAYGYILNTGQILFTKRQ